MCSQEKELVEAFEELPVQLVTNSAAMKLPANTFAFVVEFNTSKNALVQFTVGICQEL